MATNHIKRVPAARTAHGRSKAHSNKVSRTKRAASRRTTIPLAVKAIAAKIDASVPKTRHETATGKYATSKEVAIVEAWAQNRLNAGMRATLMRLKLALAGAYPQQENRPDPTAEQQRDVLANRLEVASEVVSELAICRARDLLRAITTLSDETEWLVVSSDTAKRDAMILGIGAMGREGSQLLTDLLEAIDRTDLYSVNVTMDHVRELQETQAAAQNGGAA